MGSLVFGFASEWRRELWDSRTVSQGHRPLSPPLSITENWSTTHLSEETSLLRAGRCKPSSSTLFSLLDAAQAWGSLLVNANLLNWELTEHESSLSGLPRNATSATFRGSSSPAVLSSGPHGCFFGGRGDSFVEQVLIIGILFCCLPAQKAEPNKACPTMLSSANHWLPAAP